MNSKMNIPLNDVFFYGLSLRARDAQDVRGDIFSNIMMKYLMSLKPVSNRLYRTTDDARYEYSYSFIPTKPLSWRVIKNRRVVEDIEQLSDGKYCLNYYDDHGNDVKRVIYTPDHRWIKTNYYNSIYGNSLLCSLVPKEVNGEIAILQYNTGVAYPVTLYCCPVASCNEVLVKTLERVPEPEVMALTNYGILYFACEETQNIYEQVLLEEEDKYAQANKPPVFNTEDDVKSGFCFDSTSFDTSKSTDTVLDLSQAQELTEEGFASAQAVVEDIPQEENVPVMPSDNESSDFVVSEISEDDPYSLEKELAAAIKMISDATNIRIDESAVFDNTSHIENEIDMSSAENTENFTAETKYGIDSDSVEETEKVLNDAPSNEKDIPNISASESIADDNQNLDEITNINNDIQSDISEVPASESSEPDLLNMDDAAIDDYVSNLIDSLLLDAHSTASDYLISKEDVFVSAPDESVSVGNDLISKSSSDFIGENDPDAVIESNGATYYYYGETDDNGKRSGRGKTLMSSGKTAYDGEYLNDARHGKGSFYYKDGSLCYWGDWGNNLRQGFGVGISSETGITHIGSWKDNKPVGVGVRYDSNGKFLYIDSACERTNGGIRVTDFTDNSLTVEIWDEKTLRIIKKVISIDDLLK